MIIDKIELETVLKPWWAACQNSQFPWIATPHLRKQWSRMLSSEDPVMAYVGAFALARVANPSKDERIVIETFFTRYTDDPLPPELVVRSLLDGATLPYLFLQAAFDYWLATVTSETLPAIAVLASRFYRHPDSLWVSHIDTKDLLPFIRLACAANPRFPAQSDPQTEWETALALFKGAPFSQATHTSDFLRFAHMLRTDIPGDDLRFLIEMAALAEPYASVINAHPALMYGVAPSFDPTNPSLDAIRYFSRPENPVCSIWRTYNPLLSLPWESRHEINSHAGVIAGMALFNGIKLPPVPELTHDNPDISTRLVQHPLMKDCHKPE